MSARRNDRGTDAGQDGDGADDEAAAQHENTGELGSAAIGHLVISFGARPPGSARPTGHSPAVGRISP